MSIVLPLELEGLEEALNPAGEIELEFAGTVIVGPPGPPGPPGPRGENADLSLLTVRVENTEAGITAEAQVRADADEALAVQISTLTTDVGAASAAITEEAQARADADGALTSAVTGLASRMGTAEAVIEDERTTRAAADQALSTDLTSITARVATMEGGRFGSGNAGAPGVSSSGDPDTGLYWPAGNALAVTAGGSEVARVTTAGLGIWTAPSSPLHVRYGGGGASSIITLECNQTNTAAASTIHFTAGSAVNYKGFVGWYGNTAANGLPGMRIAAQGDQFISFMTNFNTRAVITGAGLVGVRTSTPTYTFDVNGTANATAYQFSGSAWRAEVITSTSDLVWRNSANLATVVMRQAASDNSYSLQAHVLAVAKVAETNRSINAAGTVNVSGTDYAEYERKALGCAPVAKGDVIGIDAAGLITDRWADAIHFAVKSTDPSFVGGDTWTGNLDPQPLAPTRGEDEADADWSARLAAWEAAMIAWEQDAEAERVKWDRVAYAGKVPVNLPDGVTAVAGDWVVPAAGPDGGIIATVVADAAITFEQYRRAVGRVRLISGDGRPVITIKAA